MADAQRSGRCRSNPVEVQVLSSAPIPLDLFVCRTLRFVLVGRQVLLYCPSVRRSIAAAKEPSKCFQFEQNSLSGI